MIVAFSSPAASYLLLLPTIGLCAGVLGGLFGVGGGLIMIPAMLLLLGEAFGPGSLHLFKLASLISSVVVSVPAALRQAQHGALVPRLLVGLLPLGVVGVAAGTALASLFQHEQTRNLERVFGGFLIAVALFNLVRARFRDDAIESRRSACPVPRRWATYGSLVGLPAGLISGLLGIAGGVWAVPTLHDLLGMRLRAAIANSTAMIVGLAAAAALAQNVAVARMSDLDARDGWWLALWLAPGALVGGWCGAALSHRLPVPRLRDAFQVVLILAGLRLLA